MVIDDATMNRIIATVKDNNDMLEQILELLEKSDENVLVSGNEAARLLGVTAPTITTMLKQHRLTKVTIGISTGIRLSEIRKLLSRSDAAGARAIKKQV